MCLYKTSYPTDKHYLYYSGNEKAWPLKLKAEPAALATEWWPRECVLGRTFSMR